MSLEAVDAMESEQIRSDEHDFCPPSRLSTAAQALASCRDAPATAVVARVGSLSERGRLVAAQADIPLHHTVNLLTHGPRQWPLICRRKGPLTAHIPHLAPSR